MSEVLPPSYVTTIANELDILIQERTVSRA